jgi:death on curing protein
LPSDEPFWLPIEEVIEINRAAVAAAGEPHSLLRPELLESALANPKNKFAYGEMDVLNLAMALLLAISRNHPFFQGNKRTAFIAAEMFLQINGYMLDAPDTENLAELIIKCIEDHDSEVELESYLRKHIAATPDDD